MAHTVEIAELRNGDLFVPAPPPNTIEAGPGEVMRRVAAGSNEHGEWMGKVDSGHVRLIRRDPSKTFGWLDGREPLAGSPDRAGGVSEQD